MYVNPTNNLNLFVTGVYEPLETEIMRSKVKEADTMLHIGANIGYYTVLCARLVGEGSSIRLRTRLGEFRLAQKECCDKRLPQCRPSSKSDLQ